MSYSPLTSRTLTSGSYPIQILTLISSSFCQAWSPNSRLSLSAFCHLPRSSAWCLTWCRSGPTGMGSGFAIWTTGCRVSSPSALSSGAAPPALSEPGDCDQFGKVRPRANQQGSVYQDADIQHLRVGVPGRLRLSDSRILQILGHMSSLERFIPRGHAQLPATSSRQPSHFPSQRRRQHWL